MSPIRHAHALKLGPLQRAELIETLLSSFDEKRGEIDALWGVEVESRIDAYESGEIPASPAEDVFIRIEGA